MLLAAGAFGGELILLMAMPILGRLHGAEQVALLGVVIVAANAGKLIGPLKLDAAVTNADSADIGLTHLLAALAILSTTLVATVLAVAATGIGWKPVASDRLAWWSLVAFGAGGMIQTCCMRLLREDRIGWYASIKSLPALVLVPAGLLLPGMTLSAAFALSAATAAAVAAILHLRPPRGQGALAANLIRRLRECRPYIVQGSPAALLDAANMLLLTLLILHVAGSTAAGLSNQLQRMALGLSLAAGLLLSQDLWRRRFESSEPARRAFRRTLAISATVAACSAIVSAVLVGTPLSESVLGVGVSDPVLVAACLAPMLAQYAASPLTVLFFKLNKMGTYATLQLAVLLVLGCALALRGLGTDPAGLLFGLAAITFCATVAFASSTVSAVVKN